VAAVVATPCSAMISCSSLAFWPAKAATWLRNIGARRCARSAKSMLAVVICTGPESSLMVVVR
jgi:hypothetical protein